MPAIPVHVVAGPLGVGKTTAIIDYLRRRMAHERIGVLVNDFGPIGLDGEIIGADPGVADGRESGGLKTITVPGGCICCTGAQGLADGIAQLALQTDLDRYIIEPSGMAMPAQVIDLLRAVALEHALDIRPTILLMDASKFHRQVVTTMPYFIRMVESADILVANRTDRASDQAVASFEQWACELSPPKLRVLTTQFGHLPEELFELAPVDVHDDHAHDHGHEHHHEHEHHHDHRARTGGFTCEPTVQFSLDGLHAKLQALVDHGHEGATIERLKALVNTDQGWRLIEIASGEVLCRVTDYRRDNRLDWITDGQPVDAGQLQAAFMTLAV